VRCEVSTGHILLSFPSLQSGRVTYSTETRLISGALAYGLYFDSLVSRPKAQAAVWAIRKSNVQCIVALSPRSQSSNEKMKASRMDRRDRLFVRMRNNKGHFHRRNRPSRR
jgi:hypothetical protein